MAAGRYPANLAPTTSTTPTLGVLPLSSGWWGARNCSNSTSNSYQLAGGSSRFLNIGPDATFTGIKDVNNALVDSWLPTESAARAYRAFVSLPTISFSAPAQFTSGLVGQSVTLSIAENGFGAGLTKVEFYDGDSKIGEDTTSPYTLAWAPTVAGARSLTAVASNASAPVYSAFTLFLATILSNGTSGLPSGGIAGGTGKLTITYIRRKPSVIPVSGITYVAEFSDALAAWSANGAATESVTSIDADFELVTVTDSISDAAGRFVRLRITAP